MANIAVYRFQYFDRELRALVMADDYATEDSIRSLGGVLLRDSSMVVDESAVAAVSGILRRRHN